MYRRVLSVKWSLCEGVYAGAKQVQAEHCGECQVEGVQGVGVEVVVVVAYCLGDDVNGFG